MKDSLSDLIISTVNVKDYIHLHNITVAMVFTFEQVWGSTALGFGTAGGTSMTPAWTHVVCDTKDNYHVFFNGVHAYMVTKPSDTFKKDIANRDMKSIIEAKGVY